MEKPLTPLAHTIHVSLSNVVLMFILSLSCFGDNFSIEILFLPLRWSSRNLWQKRHVFRSLALSLLVTLLLLHWLLRDCLPLLCMSCLPHLNLYHLVILFLRLLPPRRTCISFNADTTIIKAMLFKSTIRNNVPKFFFVLSSIHPQHHPCLILLLLPHLMRFGLLWENMLHPLPLIHNFSLRYLIYNNFFTGLAMLSFIHLWALICSLSSPCILEHVLASGPLLHWPRTYFWALLPFQFRCILSYNTT